ncbi:MAG TPA: ROK family protein [Symbiobacteriaceae bacterium]|nr:ROK family protein [Symbiobacteriaceae bacterium]
MIAGAVDFGGTKLMVGLVDDQGTVLAQKTMATPDQPAAVADAAASLLGELRGDRELVGVGSTVPGLADGKRGILRHAPAHGWRDLPWAAMLEERTGLPVRIANDVNACALAEQRFGAGRGVDSLLWVTVSTGIGAGLIANGSIYEGAHGIAGEVGHIVVTEHGPTCGCGHKGCVESVASGPAIARRARGAGLDVKDAAEVFALARQGDPIASWMVAEAGKYLGRAFAVCFNLFDPEVLVVGGGVAQSLDLLLPHIEKTMGVRAICLPEHSPRVIATKLGYEAALIGAGALVL